MYGNRLAEILKDKGLSSDWLRKKMNVDRSTVFRWVTNDKQPSEKNKLRISEILGMPVGNIFFQRIDVRCATKPTGTDGA